MKITLQMPSIKGMVKSELELMALLKATPLKGQLSSIVGNRLQVEIKGMSFFLNATESVPLEKGDTVQLSLTPEGEVQIEKVPREGAGEPKLPLEEAKVSPDAPKAVQRVAQETPEAFVRRNALPNDKMTAAIVKGFMTKGMPIKHAAVEEVRQTWRAVGKIASALTPENLGRVLAESDKPVTEVAKLLAKSETQPLYSEKSPQSPIVSTNVEERITEDLKPILRAVQARGGFKALANDFKTFVKGLDVSEFTALYKEGGIQLKSVFHLLNATFSYKTLQEGFDSVSARLKHTALSPVELANFVEVLTAPEVSEERLNRLEKWVAALEVEDKAALKEDVQFVKAQLPLQPKVQTPPVMMQLPLVIEHEQRLVDFYVKKNKRKSVSKARFEMLIALDTQRFEQVRCHIVRHENKLEVNFGLANKAVQGIFEAHGEQIDQRLSAVSERPVFVTFTSLEATSEAFFQTTAPERVTQIDFRV
ncbi:hypothetical protein ACR6HW_18105 [Fusibacter sp. JL298sf-3]